MKTAFVILVFCLISFSALPQDQIPSYSIGIGAGFTQSFTDVYTSKVKLKPSLQTTFDYNINQFITAGIELQGGKISGGPNPPSNGTSPTFNYFDSKYATVFLNGKVQLGQLIKNRNSGFLNTFKRFYMGAGIGVIANDHDERIAVENPGMITESTYKVNYKSMDIVVPVLTGINFYLNNLHRETKLIINMNLQINMTPFDLMDGYPDINNRPDIYTLGSIGIKLPFGRRKTYFNENLNNF